MKFKRCHGQVTAESSGHMPQNLAVKIKEQIARSQAKEHQRQEQQGLGKPIISAIGASGHRVVLVGNKLMQDANWQSVHDFLGAYLRHTFGEIWGNTELAKPFVDRHFVLKWYDRLCTHQRQHAKQLGAVYSMPLTGAAAAWYQLAYDLYCLEHNAELQSKLITRIKASDPGARYEAFVAACFVRAGFEIEFENEDDKTTSHVEFTATCKRSGRKYSVEAKHRHPDDNIAAQAGRFRIGRRLQKALKKAANHTRIVFIDINTPDDAIADAMPHYLQSAQNDLRKFEGRTDSQGAPLPPAYIFVTNLPFEHDLDAIDVRCAVLAEGFQIPYFKMDTQFPSPLDAHRARKLHQDMHQLRDSMFQHTAPPSTFDGEAPEFAFTENPARLLIGNTYLARDDQGLERPAKLTAATVIESECAVMGEYTLLETGEAIMCKSPLTEVELQAYKRHPNTFFGVVRTDGKEIKSPLELFDFFMHGFKDTPRDRLVEMLRGAPDFEDIKTLSRDELLEIYADRQACFIFSRQAQQLAK